MDPYDYLRELRGQYGLKDKLLRKYKFVAIRVSNKTPSHILLYSDQKSEVFPNVPKRTLDIKYDDQCSLIWNIQKGEFEVWD